MKAGQAMVAKKVLIASDHPVMRNGLKQMINYLPDMTCAGEASNGVETLEQTGQNKYDLLIMDITSPYSSGLNILKEVKKLKPQLPVLVLSIHPESEYELRAIKAGASGYLLKTRNGEDFVKAVDRVINGHKYITGTLAEELAHKEKTVTPNMHASLLLSDYEYQVLRLIAKGNPVVKIAKQLTKSTSAIYSCRRKILKKTATRNDAELIRFIIK